MLETEQNILNEKKKIAKEENQNTMRGTYSFEDNKLRLYSSLSLDEQTFQRIKNAGFKWAPRQKLFVAPMWTPSRFNLLLELCGEIENEEQSLLERAEKRACRFEEYGVQKAADSNAAHENINAILNNISPGQPILVGHHSERRHRKDIQRIDDNLRKSVELQHASEYWENRASSAIYEAKRKGCPDVRKRRIKKLNAEMRKIERGLNGYEQDTKLWNSPDLTQEKAEFIASGIKYSCTFHDQIRDGKIKVQDAKSGAIKSLEPRIENSKCWIEHLKLRIQYETKILEQQGAADLLK
jgi:hypothetical protein